ncbi:MAG TPA: ribonuclease HII [Candidatus Deferrimicrobium sp.]|nr:ribonuclease HII [Candidatus Deferrimicrobium sp.]
MPIIAGIEEAGRGPVIGPMVMAITAVDSKNESVLREIGVKDSKQLSPKQRSELFIQLEKILTTYKVIIISPEEIDAALKARNSNLNWLEADKAVELIKLITNTIKIDELYIDCPSTNIESWCSYLKKGLNVKISRLVAEHKADQNYPIVSAASIIAKVIRDQEIVKLQQKLEVDFGSGYTSDPRTRAFLEDWVKKHKKLPNFVRKSWITAKKMLEGIKQRKLNGN